MYFYVHSETAVLSGTVLSLLAGRRRPWQWVHHWAADCQTRHSFWGSSRRSKAPAFSCSGRWRANLVRTFWLEPCASSSTTPSCLPYRRCLGETQGKSAPIHTLRLPAVGVDQQYCCLLVWNHIKGHQNYILPIYLLSSALVLQSTLQYFLITEGNYSFYQL